MDWNRIIQDLVSAGMTQAAIAAAIGVSPSAITEMMKGEIIDPRWSRGDALMALHRERCLSATARASAA